MHVTLHGTNEDVVHPINLYSLVDHEDYCQMHDGVFVCNHGIYSEGIGMLSLLIEAVDVNETFMVMNN